MIVRRWIGYASKANAEAYRKHISDTVFPEVENMAGFRQAMLLSREISNDGIGEIEFHALTIWQDMDSVHAFSGDDLFTAVVEPHAREVLSRFETKVEYFDVAENVGLSERKN